MKILLLFACLAFANTSLGAPAKKRAPNSGAGQTPHVLQMDEDFPIESLQTEGVVLHPLSENAPQSEMLSPQLQDQFFQEAGLAAFTKTWDGFEKDRLALRAENQDPKEVAARYHGRLPEPAIRKLKSLIESHRRSRK